MTPELNNTITLEINAMLSPHLDGRVEPQALEDALASLERTHPDPSTRHFDPPNLYGVPREPLDHAALALLRFHANLTTERLAAALARCGLHAAGHKARAENFQHVVDPEEAAKVWEIPEHDVIRLAREGKIPSMTAYGKTNVCRWCLEPDKTPVEVKALQRQAAEASKSKPVPPPRREWLKYGSK